MEEYSRKIIPVTRMDCPTCITTIEKELVKLEGVKETRVNYIMKKIVVDYNPKKISLPEIEGRVEDLGYKILYKKYGSLFDKISKALQKGKRIEKKSLKRVVESNFEELILKSNKLVIVFFTSPKCPTCNLIESKLKDIEKKFNDRIFIYELNITETQKWQDYNVMSVPTLIYFEKGKEVSRLKGLVEKDLIETKILEVRSFR